MLAGVMGRGDHAIIRFLVTLRGTSTRHALRTRPASANRGGRASIRRVVRAAAERRISEGGSLPYLPGLDGLRAIAVIAVLLYHAELPWIPGGFLGVEVFFVLSGFLITSLLAAEWRRRGTIDLKAFWLRRARRLLPALFLLLTVMLGFAVLFLPDEVAGLRGDAAAATGYVTNWYLIFSEKSYFEMVGRPPMLEHLWSLAVEEQFYLLWPLLFVAAARRWGAGRRMVPVVLAGVLTSAALMAVLYQPDTDPSRIYYGTDTRAAGLLLGCALGLVWSPVVRAGRVQRALTWLLDVFGLVAVAGLAVMFVRVDEMQAFLYQGGFVVVGL